MSLHQWVSVVSSSLPFITEKNLIELVIEYLSHPQWWYRSRKDSSEDWIEVDTAMNWSIEVEWTKWKEGKLEQGIKYIHSYTFGAKSCNLDFREMKVYELKSTKNIGETINLIGDMKRTMYVLDYQWWYLDTEWISMDFFENMQVEKEWIAHMNGSRKGRIVYHSFGDGLTTLIDFSAMKTYCGSGRCDCFQNSLTSVGHNEFQIKRTPDHTLK